MESSTYIYFWSSFPTIRSDFSFSHATERNHLKISTSSEENTWRLLISGGSLECSRKWNEPQFESLRVVSCDFCNFCGVFQTMFPKIHCSRAWQFFLSSSTLLGIISTGCVTRIHSGKFILIIFYCPQHRISL